MCFITIFLSKGIFLPYLLLLKEMSSLRKNNIITVVCTRFSSDEILVIIIAEASDFSLSVLIQNLTLLYVCLCVAYNVLVVRFRVY